MENQPSLAQPTPTDTAKEGSYVAVGPSLGKAPFLVGTGKADLPTVDALVRLGVKLLHENDLPGASAAFHSAVVLNPNDPGLWGNCGLALNKMKSFADAAACLEYSVALKREQPQTWLLLGSSRNSLGDTAAAETAYRVALEQQPNCALGWQCLGLILQQKGACAEAIACFVSCVQHGGATPAIWTNLGNLYYQTGKVLEAHRAFRAAGDGGQTNPICRKMLRSTGFMKDLLQGIPVDDALEAYRASLVPADGLVDQNIQGLLTASFAFLNGFGHTTAAIAIGRKRFELWPQEPSAAYLLAAVTGQGGLDRSPADYIVTHFDEFADQFDAKLVDTLGYDVPGKLISLLQTATVSGRLYDTVDAGCGTGLCGPLLRPLARDLTGVDLSAKMIEQAARRGVYGRLVCEELVAFLNRSKGCFDLLVAADVLIYFGDLVPVLSAAANALRPGGLLAFSTELSSEGDYRLGPAGRFAHAPSYVLSAANTAFTQHACVETTIRLEAMQRIRGNLFVFRRH